MLTIAITIALTIALTKLLYMIMISSIQIFSEYIIIYMYIISTTLYRINLYNRNNMFVCSLTLQFTYENR